MFGLSIRRGEQGARRLACVAGLAAYTIAAAALFHPVLLHPRSRSTLGGRSDPGAFLWYLDWVARSVADGSNPLVTHAMFAPHGTNLMWNVSMPLLGVVLAPVTLTMGAVAAFNLACVAGLALTAATAWWWLSRHVERPAVAWLGGALVGFGPYQAAQMGGHLGISFLPLIPVILVLVEDVVWRHPERRRQRAVLLGLAVAGQLLINEEAAVLLAVGLLLAAVFALALRPRAVLGAIGSAWPAAALAAVVAILAAALPLAVQFFGPLRTGGPGYPQFASTARDLISPTSRMLVRPFPADSTFTDGRLTTIYESGSYLGIPLLVLLAVGMWWLRRDWRAWAALLTAVVLFLLCRGPGVDAAGQAGWRLPAGPLFRVPLLKSLVAQRFAMPFDLAIAFLLALTLDALLGPKDAPRPWWRGASVLIGAVVVAVSLTPRPTPGPWEVVVPRFFTDSSTSGVGSIAGHDVLLLPAPGRDGNDGAAMLWQAEADMRFDMFDGYSYVDFDGVLALGTPPDPITTLGQRMVAGGPGPSRAERRDIRGWLHHQQVDDVLVVPSEDPAHGYQQAARAVLGRGTLAGGVIRWVVP